MRILTSRSLGPLPHDEELLVSSRGEMWWTMRGTSDEAEQDVLVFKHPRRPARVIQRGLFGDLRIVQGRTLQWFGAYRHHWRPLEPGRERGVGGCHQRPYAETVLDTGMFLITRVRAATPDDLSSWVTEVWRSCDRMAGREVTIVDWTSGRHGYLYFAAQLRAHAGQWAVFQESHAEKADGYDLVRLVNLASGAVQTASWRAPAGPTRSSGYQVVVTADGIAAFASGPSDEYNGTAGQMILTVLRPDGRTEQIDAGRGAAITGLHTDGAVIRWLHDGEPRAYAGS
jgi:hypothetical protein